MSWLSFEGVGKVVGGLVGGVGNGLVQGAKGAVVGGAGGAVVGAAAGTVVGAPTGPVELLAIPTGAAAGAAGGAVIGGGIGAVEGVKAGVPVGQDYGASAGRWLDDKISQMTGADEEADDRPQNGDASGVCGQCAEEQEQRLKELESESDAKQRTKGRTKHGEKEGGMGEADKDFDSLQPKNVKDINTKYGPGRTGELEDGKRITVRPGSSEGPPTLEVRNPANGRGTEIRYRPLGS